MAAASDYPPTFVNPQLSGSEWERVVSKKRALRDLDLWMYADPSRVNDSITVVDDASGLVEALTSRIVSSEAVIRAYMQQSVYLFATPTCIYIEVD